MLAIALTIAALTAGGYNGVPTVILERLKTQPTYIVSTLEVQENGNVRRFATVYLKPYYLLVEFKMDKGRPYFLNSDIYEVFLVRGEEIITIWTRSPPAAPPKTEQTE